MSDQSHLSIESVKTNPQVWSPRRRRQAGLFFGGVGFVLVSSLITRRSIARRHRHSVNPIAHPRITTRTLQRKFATSADATTDLLPGQVSGFTAEAKAASEVSQASAEQLENSRPVLALEALTIATLNVFSWSIMTLGGVLWCFDISNMEDLRRKVRGGLGVDGSGRSEQEVEEEMEEWLATVLTRKEDKQKAKERATENFNERGRCR